MQNKTNSQKIIATATVIIIALVVIYIAWGMMTDDGSGIWVLALLFYALPICVALAILSLVYLKKDAKRAIPVKKKFVSTSFSPVRILMIVSGIVAAYFLYRILSIFIPLLLTPQPPEPEIVPWYVESQTSQPTQ